MMGDFCVGWNGTVTSAWKSSAFSFILTFIYLKLKLPVIQSFKIRASQLKINYINTCWLKVKIFILYSYKVWQKVWNQFTTPYRKRILENEVGTEWLTNQNIDYSFTGRGLKNISFNLFTFSQWFRQCQIIQIYIVNF